jgi:hypothetical protein
VSGGQGASRGHGEPIQGLDSSGSGAEGGARRAAWAVALMASVAVCSGARAGRAGAAPFIGKGGGGGKVQGGLGTLQGLGAAQAGRW